ncbi:glutathione transferase GstA [Pseudomonas sp. FW306-02-F02-AA]|uniref:Glutathione S-transferase n=2 Tax=Pseudomonas TaxID=286 RepID=A0A0N9WNJ2_PSEFL|nr:glutathione S-transferase [Pseudomonas fluorescens]PMZ02023.1 glutathione transferase GstA [Pseudomonas sp. FW306-02-F02-AB]PMZ08031.1 glutathione transferase GstA [Pseudomonas sp. FW306-02-H06C]PMZ13003.1 glutathione transferase GstA [Pseudomonas sp. FW306-02-F02-AA]PMZ19799.1 glutathione transferase GstA [Pseudomonas sp. FW306-02-F08-AA]PMZ24714.1 glutathione transferase GstA [Pseudomonas sp. FW306-02-F04-BA]PMZ31331.1 glutathione transferase GstA [Pseudomonas sp. FW306-02-H06B]PMZ38207
MMILFYAAGASSLAPHILLREAGASFSLEKVDLMSKQWSGGDYDLINPKSYVPTLKTDDGAILTECAVILQYISDQHSERNLLPAQGRFERYRALEWLGFISTEVHKNFITPERHGGVSANFLAKTIEGQSATRRLVSPRLAYVDHELRERDYLMGDGFCAPDAYLFTMLTWAKRLEIDLSAWDNLQAYFQRVSARSAVGEALKVEGPPHSLRPLHNVSP